jgi:hypothetical protein
MRTTYASRYRLPKSQYLCIELYKVAKERFDFYRLKSDEPGGQASCTAMDGVPLTPCIRTVGFRWMLHHRCYFFSVKCPTDNGQRYSGAARFQCPRPCSEIHWGLVRSEQLREIEKIRTAETSLLYGLHSFHVLYLGPRSRMNNTLALQYEVRLPCISPYTRITPNPWT